MLGGRQRQTTLCMMMASYEGEPDGAAECAAAIVVVVDRPLT